MDTVPKAQTDRDTRDGVHVGWTLFLKYRRTEIQEIWCTRGMDIVPKVQTDRDTREYGVHVGWTESIPAQTQERIIMVYTRNGHCP